MEVMHSGPFEVMNPPINSPSIAFISAITDRFGLSMLLLVPSPITYPGAPFTIIRVPIPMVIIMGSFSSGLISPLPVTEISL